MKEIKPIKKKEIHSEQLKRINYADFLVASNQTLPQTMDDINSFLKKYSKHIGVLFLCSEIKQQLVLNNSYTNSLRNKPISKLLRTLKHKDSFKNAKLEITQRFVAQDYSTQHKILEVFFNTNRITIRSALTLMHKCNIWEKQWVGKILEELNNDKNISKIAKKAGTDLLMRHATQDDLIGYEELALRALPYYFCCAKGIVNEIDMAQMSPEDYLKYCFMATPTKEDRHWFPVYIGMVISEIESHRYINIKDKTTWIPSLFSLFSSQELVSDATQYGKLDCIKKFYAFDREIQQYVVDSTQWREASKNEEGEHIEEMMTCFYSLVLEYLSKNEILGDLSKFKRKEVSDNSESNLDDLPF